MEPATIRKWVPSITTVALLAVAAVWAGWWLTQTHEESAINIQAAYDVPDLALPVFAQFVVTQHIMIDEPALLTELVVPLYAPAESQWLRVDLRRGEDLIRRWRYHPSEFEKVVFAELPIAPAQIIDGNLQIVFSGQHIMHEEQAHAPRLFVEPSMSSYRDGGYRIAQNAKVGNVSLELYEQVTNKDLLVQRWNSQPLETLAQGLWMSLAVLSICVLPWTWTHHDRQQVA